MESVRRVEYTRFDEAPAPDSNDDRRRARFTSAAFAVCLVTVFVDVCGQYLSSPVVVPYAVSLGADESTQALVVSLPFLGRLIGGVLMPIVADVASRKLAVWLSALGSAVAYATSSLAVYVGIRALLLGRFVGGVFGQTMPLLMAYLLEMHAPDMAATKVKSTQLMSVNLGAPMLLAPLGGMLAQYGLSMPFRLASCLALLSLCFALLNFRDVAEIRPRPAAPPAAPQPTPADAAAKLQAVARSKSTRQRLSATWRGPADGSSPWADPTLQLMALTYFAFGLALNATYVRAAHAVPVLVRRLVHTRLPLASLAATDATRRVAPLLRAWR
jgi:MFS family permease